MLYLEFHLGSSALHCLLHRQKLSDMSWNWDKTCVKQKQDFSTVWKYCDCLSQICVLAICLTTWPPRPIYIMASTYLSIQAVSPLADILHRNNSPDLMRRWNAFNCGEVCIDHRIDQHIVDQIENSLKIWSTLIDLREHCRVTIFLCFSCCSSKKKYSSHPHISSYSYPGSSFPVGVEFWAISSRPNDGLYIAAPLLSAH